MSDTEGDLSDLESEDELPPLEDELPIKMKKEKPPKVTVKKKNYRFVAEVSTEGIAEDSPLYQGLSLKDKNELLRCDICGKYYCADMLTHTEHRWGISCYHCLYYMQFADLKVVDGVDGRMLIVDYILKCAEAHKTVDTCPRKTDTGGCILCMHNFGIPMEDIKEMERLYPVPEEKRKKAVPVAVPKGSKIFRDEGVSGTHSTALEL